MGNKETRREREILEAAAFRGWKRQLPPSVRPLFSVRLFVRSIAFFVRSSFSRSSVCRSVRESVYSGFIACCDPGTRN